MTAAVGLAAASVRLGGVAGAVPELFAGPVSIFAAAMRDGMDLGAIRDCDHRLQA